MSTSYSCNDCMYYDNRGEKYGHCRRYAPQPKLGDASTLSMVIWPYVSAISWCGEFIDWDDDE